MMMLSNANKVLAKIMFWGEILRQRKQLSEMDDYLLKDIRISRVEATREANRKFWDHSPVVDESLQNTHLLMGFLAAPLQLLQV